MTTLANKTDFDLSKDCPTVDQFIRLISESGLKWELVAVHLTEMSHKDIEEIKKELQDEEAQQLCFAIWMSKSPDLSRDNLVIDLEKAIEKAKTQNGNESDLNIDKTIDVANVDNDEQSFTCTSSEETIAHESHLTISEKTKTAKTATIDSRPCLPTVSELLVILHDLVDWELVAIHLRGMTDAEIGKIKESEQSIDKQKYSMFSKWLSMCPDASWDDVVTALEKGKKTVLAERVEKMKTEKAEKKETPDTLIVPTPVTSEKTQTRFTFPEDEEEEIVNELQTLNDTFTGLILEVRAKIKEKVKNGETTISEIVEKIQVANLKHLKNITECKTVDELNNSITNKCSFVDGSILHRIVKFGLPENNDLKVKTEQHMKQAREFRKKASIKHLKNHINENIATITSQAPIEVKLNDVWGRTNIDDVTMLIEYLTDNKDVGPKLVKVVSSSVAVTLMISEDDEACFNITTENKEQFMCLIGMFYLQVGENPPIFQEDENMNYTFENGLLEAAKIGHIQAIEFILNIGINIDYQNDEGKTALILASEYGHSEAVKLILSAGASVDIQGNSGETAVMVAKTVDIYQTLVQANANTNIVTHKGSTPLMVSCIAGNHDVANYLLFTLKHKITTRSDGGTLLMAASQGGNNIVVEYLLNNGHDPNIQDSSSRTAILLSCFNGHYTVTEIILKHNADPNIPDINGWTPLMSASQEGHQKIVELLLQKGVDPNSTNNENGQTALIQASRNGHNETVQLLLSNGAEPNIQNIDGEASIQLSCFNGHYKVTEILLKHNADPNIPNNNGWTPMMNACQQGHHKIVELLLQKGVGSDTQNRTNGRTALMQASQNGHIQTVIVLLSNGAEPNIQNNDGKTAIWLSCFNDHKTVTEILLKHNADPNIPDNNGWTPLMCASHKGNHEIVQILMINGITDMKMHSKPITNDSHTNLDSTMDKSHGHVPSFWAKKKPFEPDTYNPQTQYH